MQSKADMISERFCNHLMWRVVYEIELVKVSVKRGQRLGGKTSCLKVPMVPIAYIEKGVGKPVFLFMTEMWST